VVRSQRALENCLQLILWVRLGQVLSTHDYQQGRAYAADAELRYGVRNWRAANRPREMG
jgi:hypothetical protein